MKQKLLVVALCCWIVILIVTYWPRARHAANSATVIENTRPQETPGQSGRQIPFQDHQQIRATLPSGKMVSLEVVTSAESITQGLSGRRELGSDGMLFLFANKRMPTFWMKEMQFPLDLIWLDGEVVLEVTENVPAPDPAQPLRELPVYQPAVEVDGVLEVPAGGSTAWGLTKGSVVKFVR
ncbi:DUF192 domain-containing protein [Candidatus Woesebacteria bacterium]|nr:DUF192 domain-containing protein [Candidatus Woesebacteria bacterium]